MSYNEILIEKKLREYLEEDCQYKDVSSEFIPGDADVTAKITAKSKGYIAGLKELEILFRILGVKVEFHVKDGDQIERGVIIAEIEGNARRILLGERIGLNILTHMSAITSTVQKYKKLIEHSGKKPRIACTRKTLPGLRMFEKRAVELGGGDTHRFSLDDMVLLKDTHLRYYNGKIQLLLQDVKQKASFSKKIEIEIEKIEDIIIAASNGADIIMLDNMTPDQVKEAIEILKREGLRDRIILEISGGINLENILDYVEAEPDIISTSKLTQFPSEHVDLSLRFD